ncbi:hypothetical protein LX36DRAFT_358635 [Colletotrichum falcatum]|nr:hypothetical protein LX36DRAFT_358635 [Colletotrichum falcatum]
MPRILPPCLPTGLRSKGMRPRVRDTLPTSMSPYAVPDSIDNILIPTSPAPDVL